MKKLILITMTAILFTACGNDDSNKSGANTGNNINNNPKTPTVTVVEAELAVCSEDNVKSYREAVDAVNKVASYFSQDGALTPAGQFADINNSVATTKSSCSYFINNYAPIDCKTVATETQAETVIHGSEVARSCESTTQFLESIGR